MTNKLHTSQKTQEIFNSLGQSLRLQPFILSKLAIALSVRKGQLQANDFKTDNNGLELSRQVIFGDHDLLFKSLIINNEGKVIREDDYFPGLVKAHLDRGAKLLEDEKRYSKDAVKLRELALHQFLKILSQVHFSANDLDVHTSTGFFRKKHKGMCFFHLRKKHILSERLGFHYSAYGFCRSLYLQYKSFEQKLQ